MPVPRRRRRSGGVRLRMAGDTSVAGVVHPVLRSGRPFGCTPIVISALGRYRCTVQERTPCPASRRCHRRRPASLGARSPRHRTNDRVPPMVPIGICRALAVCDRARTREGDELSDHESRWVPLGAGALGRGSATWYRTRVCGRVARAGADGAGMASEAVAVRCWCSAVVAVAIILASIPIIPELGSVSAAEVGATDRDVDVDRTR